MKNIMKLPVALSFLIAGCSVGVTEAALLTFSNNSSHWVSARFMRCGPYGAHCTGMTTLNIAPGESKLINTGEYIPDATRTEQARALYGYDPGVLYINEMVGGPASIEYPDVETNPLTFMGMPPK